MDIKDVENFFLEDVNVGAIMMLFDKIIGVSVGTDLSRPAGISRGDKDVINRSLQIPVSNIVKEHHYAPSRITGRTKA